MCVCVFEGKSAELSTFSCWAGQQVFYEGPVIKKTLAQLIT